MGDEAADDLVTWMMVVDSNRSELRELIEAYNGRMDVRFEAYELRMDARFAANDARFAAFESRLDTGLAHLEARMERRFADLLKWSFVFWVGAVGAVAALAGALK
jgi:hypothetical protein